MTLSTGDTKRLLKSRDLRELGSKVAFNFDDIQQRCRQDVEQANRQAREVREAAHLEAETIRREEFEKSRQEGLKQGLQDADEDVQRRAEELANRWVDERLETALPALQGIVDGLDREREHWLSEWESALIRISVAIAEKIVCRTIEVQPNISIEMIREALRLVTTNTKLLVRLNPADREQIGDFQDRFSTVLSSVAEVSIVADDSITLGGCLLESEHGIIDARLESQLQRIATELTG